ncbi:MAG: response regulator transcription factor [Clostridiales bacterium]|nr:response regulator transcription factor [Clostridiales bacterium]MBS5878010.1 response regulator transcription factor [Clostridiales bacterium]MDU0939904.1 response regulator transcription factor [Clostridiales bacterium]MDU1042414.1 response regulator transcription factor [Clostridiales bacterium]
MKILILEDDQAIGMGLEYSLTNEGFEVDLAENVKSAYELIKENIYSLFILDLTLPDGSGYEVCRKIKENGDFPVIFLTAMEDEVNIVMGLELGGDDYITKPFRIKELTARIKTVLRRYGKNTSDGVVRVGDLAINTKEMSVTKAGEPIVLTSMEYRLLLTFVNNIDSVLTRNRILEELWDIDGDFINDNTLTVYIGRLRNKIEDDPADPKLLRTVRGMGYILENEQK